MVDSLAMFFGKRRRKVKRSSGSIVVGGRKRKLYKGKNGGLYYRTRSGKTYVKGRKSGRKSGRKCRTVRRHRRKGSPRRRRHAVRRHRRCSPRHHRRRRRRSPVRRRRRRSPVRRRRRRSPIRWGPQTRRRRSRYGYGLGQPSLIDMMGPAGLSLHPHMSCEPGTAGCHAHGRAHRYGSGVV